MELQFLDSISHTKQSWRVCFDIHFQEASQQHSHCSNQRVGFAQDSITCSMQLRLPPRWSLACLPRASFPRSISPGVPPGVSTLRKMRLLALFSCIFCLKGFWHFCFASQLQGPILQVHLLHQVPLPYNCIFYSKSLPHLYFSCSPKVQLENCICHQKRLLYSSILCTKSL